MTYVVVFDVAKAGYKSLAFPAFGLVFVVIGIILVAVRDRIPRFSQRGPVARGIFPFGFLAFAVVWTLVAFVSTYAEYRAAVSARRRSSAQVVEGKVTDLSSDTRN